MMMRMMITYLMSVFMFENVCLCVFVGPLRIWIEIHLNPKIGFFLTNDRHNIAS